METHKKSRFKACTEGLADLSVRILTKQPKCSVARAFAD